MQKQQYINKKLKFSLKKIHFPPTRSIVRRVPHSQYFAYLNINGLYLNYLH